MIADAPHSSSANTFEQETPRIFQFPSPENKTSRSSEAVAPPPFPVPVVFHPRSSKPSARDPSPMPPTPQRKSHRIRFIPLSDSVPFKPVVCELREGGAPIVITRTSRFETPLGTLTFTSRVISRRHAELSVRSGPRFFIRDTKSASGTFVNSLRLSEANTTSICHQLNDGDNLQLGVRYGLDAVPLDPLHIPVRMMVQIGPQLGGETVDVFRCHHYIFLILAQANREYVIKSGS
ncbi:hypothetical protein C8J57DRAFT_1090069 [Mycena rebaudengoi]|nr:hypothetical protein C8J57DRAFT_1090069 [Mycena rebaudengoi]